MKTINKVVGGFLAAVTLMLSGCNSSDNTTVTPVTTSPGSTTTTTGSTTTTTGTSTGIVATMSATATVNNCATSTGLAKVVCLAEAFKATLNATQLTAAQLTYTKANAIRWSNFPNGATNPSRVGVMFSTLSATQLAAARELMSAVLALGVPGEGYDELVGNLAADDYLAVANNNSTLFGAGNYFIAFLGPPSLTGLWELQYGGHHFAVANTYNGGKVTGLTPSFRGVEPLAAFVLNGQTYQPMTQERQAFADMLAGLSSTEQAAAKLTTSFSDILLGPGKDAQFPTTKVGLKVSTLTAAKQALVLNAIKLYVNDLDATTAAATLASYTADLANTYIAYSGTGTLNTQGDYVRIDGPGVWIEYSAQGAAHPHSVWRDHTTDYGGN